MVQTIIPSESDRKRRKEIQLYVIVIKMDCKPASIYS